MRKYYLIGFICGLLTHVIQAQTPAHLQSNNYKSSRTKNPVKSYTISGLVKDKTNGEVLIGATVYIRSLGKGTATNVYGFYSLTVPKGTYQVICSYIGYQNLVQNIRLESNQKLHLEMSPTSDQLDEIVVTDKKINEHITKVEMSVEKLSMEQIKSMPAFLGEVDVIKSIIALPGVSTVGEGTTGFNVRGGGVDQNLVLLDESIVYNSSHLFGFFSIFNPNSVKDVKLYKGAIPAKYGGRLSSVLDIRQKEGNTKQFSGAGGIGLVSSRLTLETPIVKDKSSLLIAGRRSYADLFLKLSPNEALRKNKAYFYDLNTKFNYTINDNNRLYVSGYFGRDVFGLGDEFNFSWGNTAATIRWNHLFSSKLFSNVSAMFSDYNYSLGVPQGSFAFSWDAGIKSYQLKNDLTWFINSNYTLDFGVSGILYQFQPGKIKFSNALEGVTSLSVEPEKALEMAAYFNSEHKLNNALTLNYGLRYSAFMNMGERKVHTYKEGAPRRDENVVSTRNYSNNEVIQTYQGLEPRIGLRWQLNESNSVKMSYARNRQYIHLISNTTAPIPTDIWKASDSHIPPQIADQVALGYFHNFAHHTFELSAEVYYKKMQNLVDYKNGAELLLNENLETELLSGEGRAYGLELMLKKPTGKLNGWISYTLARTERMVNGAFPEERINNGNYYPADYDKLHNFTMVATYQATKRLSISANFVYNTGRPFTLPDAKYQYSNMTIIDYSGRNQNRIPDYHRLDLSVTLKGKGKPNRKWKGEWVFSLYNVYSRRNAYSIYFSGDGQAQNDATKLSILGSVVPAVTYNFSF
ncbi:TonB-dependent receptor [Microscilla marina]|uniref:Putative outer membrane protein probably involved in nutrient binding n=1 Tax=Microscilla marina ATCC 23134 TaxID=313606 RepID=A1ZZ37_MICM2|nr:TonB-dependent receptor [Microscilla marina]EAY24359.1 putative outer membrane protein probably involved in nutrient binding [Microscilla marina ATCC 23134]